jgi:anti-sigma-K factor RskA
MGRTWRSVYLAAAIVVCLAFPSAATADSFEFEA